MPLEVRVDAIRYLAEDTHAYEFVSPYGIALPTAGPGDHVDVHLPNGLVGRYSLLELRPDRYVVAVKRAPASRGGSRFLHEDLRVGTRLLVGEPQNQFPFDPDATHSVFVAGGIGITPIMTMVDHAAANGVLGTALCSAVEPHRFQERPCPPRRSRSLLGQPANSRPAAGHRGFDRVVRSGSPLYCCGPESMIAAFGKLHGRSRKSALVSSVSPRCPPKAAMLIHGRAPKASARS